MTTAITRPGLAAPAPVDINPAAGVATNGRHFASDVAVRYGGEEITYAGLDERAARLAQAFLDRGAVPGDRIAYVGLNSPAFLTVMLAAWRIGAIFVPANFRLAPAELRRLLVDSGSTIVVAEPEHAALVETVRAGTPVTAALLVDDDPQAPAGEPLDGWEGWARIVADTAPVEAVRPAGFDDPAVLMFTSGTTGSPKGVILTFGNIWWNAVNVDSRIDTRRGDVTYAIAPLFHIGALNSFVIRLLVRGGTVVVRRVYEPARMLADLVEHRVNSMFAVPAMLIPLARLPEIANADLSALRAVVVAGAPVPPDLIRSFLDLGVHLQQAWGLTETAPFATHLPVEQTLHKTGSAGIPMPHTQVRVVDALTNEPVQAGEPGEIVVRGPNVTPGYWENPAATAAAFDDDGWFHSGDIGYLDDDGCLFIVDRLKDMVITGGENVYPAEVERVLAAMPGVRDVAVVGVPSAKWGEEVAAVISVESGADVSLEAIRDFAAERLARYKLPRRLHVVDAVPRNASGKLVKTTIRTMVAGEAQR